MPKGIWNKYLKPSERRRKMNKKIKSNYPQLQIFIKLKWKL